MNFLPPENLGNLKLKIENADFDISKVEFGQFPAIPIRLAAYLGTELSTENT